MALDWDPPLQIRRGSPNRLLGIEVHHDFEWQDLFPDERTQFKHGKSLARLAVSECPAGKTPALLLTVRDDVDEQPIETESHFFVVVRVRHYLAEATNDAAAAYYAHRLGSGITGITRLREFIDHPDVIRTVLDEKLDIGRIAAWAAQEEGRIAQLRAIAGAAPPGQEPANAASVIAALRTLQTLDAQVVEALEALLGGGLARGTKLRFLRALTEDPTGRSVTSEVLGERIGERLADVRETAEGFSNLLESSASTETDLQRYIEAHAWLVGLEYVRVRPRRGIPRGEPDFILERYDGFHDLLELKSPHDPIVEAPDAVDGAPPSASEFSLSRALGEAIAQVHVYRDVMTEDAATVERLFGLQKTRDPKLVIVIGMAAQLPAHRLQVLRSLNLSLHRVEVVPYDVLERRIRIILNNIEAYASRVPMVDFEPEVQDDAPSASAPTSAGD